MSPDKSKHVLTVEQIRKSAKGKPVDDMMAHIRAELRKVDESTESIRSLASSARARVPETLELEIEPDPVWDVLTETQKTNGLLVDLLESAAKDAVEAKKSTRKALVAAWVAIGVTVVIAILQTTLSPYQGSVPSPAASTSTAR